MALVRDNVISLLNIIDPKTKDGTTIDSTNISTWNTNGGDRFTSALVIQFYNRSRLALFEAMRAKWGEGKKLSLEIGDQIVSTTLSFTLASTVSTASKPTGYARFLSLSTSTDVPIFLAPIELVNVVRYGKNLDYIQSASNIHVFDVGSQFVSYGTQGVNSGNSFITTAATYKFLYYGITNYVASDITGGATVESFNDRYIPMLMELGQAIADEQGTIQINTLAQKLLGV